MSFRVSPSEASHGANVLCLPEPSPLQLCSDSRSGSHFLSGIAHLHVYRNMYSLLPACTHTNTCAQVHTRVYSSLYTNIHKCTHMHMGMFPVYTHTQAYFQPVDIYTHPVFPVYRHIHIYTHVCFQSAYMFMWRYLPLVGESAVLVCISSPLPQFISA